MSRVDSNVESIHCNKCGHKTKHATVAERTQEGSESNEQFDISWTYIYEMLECYGCEEITVRRKEYFSEWLPGEVRIIYYPPRIGRRLPAWKNKLPKDMVTLLEEVYNALQADSRSLAMMGARALIDMVIFEKVGDVGTFAQKLNALEAGGFISKINKEVLSAALGVGHAAAHRGHRPEPKNVQHVMDIVENLLQATILQTVVDDLKKATPTRTSAKKASKSKGQGKAT